MSNNANQKWAELPPLARAGIIVGSIAIGALLLIKVVPALIAGMGIGALLAVLFVPYWLPTIIASMRKHPSKGAIFAVNFFFGWTFIGWVICFIWSLGDTSGRGASVVVNTVVSPSFVVGNTGQAYPPQYQIGDVVNGHRFDGITWVPETQPIASPSAPAPSIDAPRPPHVPTSELH